MLGSEFQGVRVILNNTGSSPMPYGKDYRAKGAYKQGKRIVVVGQIKEDGTDNTIRISYLASEVESLHFF